MLEADGNTADVPELPTDESREAEGAVGDEPASLDKEKEEKAVEEEAPKAENGDKNGHENGTNGDAKPEADCKPKLTNSSDLTWQLLFWQPRKPMR